jgi:hypothetical protein
MHEGEIRNSDPGGLQFHKNNHLSKYSGGIARNVPYFCICYSVQEEKPSKFSYIETAEEKTACYGMP